jgi:protein ImuA
LPNKGWPYPALIEVLTDYEGIGALRLWLPLMATLSQQQWLIWVSPPHAPYAAVLQQAGIALNHLLLIDPMANADTAAVPSQKAVSTSHTKIEQAQLWAFEQALRFADCGASLAWLKTIKPLQLRRLQLACESGMSLGILFRPASFATEASPAPLRLLLAPTAHGLELRLLKSRGGMREQPCHLVLN